MGRDAVRLRVDGELCMGHGRCYRMLPDLLTYDDEGFVAIRDDSVGVPTELLATAEDVAATCPEGAISLTADDA
jgi:ferredoxin